MTVALKAAASLRAVPPLLLKGARVVGGGTLVVGDLNYGRAGASLMVTLDGLGLDRIAVKGSTVTLGAMVTMAAIARDSRLAALHPVANAIGGPALRAMATVGGNLFAPSPYGDMAVALLTLDAKVSLTGSAGRTTLALAEFLQDRGVHGSSLVTGVIFRLPGDGRFRYAKVVRRKPVSAAVLSIAACLPMQRGKIAGARVAYGGMAGLPVRAFAVEAALEGKRLDSAKIAAASALAADGTSPADDAYASAWYRREVLPIHLARLLAA